MMRQRAGEIPLLTFDCTSDEPYHTAFMSIAARHGVAVIEEVTLRFGTPRGTAHA